MRTLPKGRYVIAPVDAVPALTAEEELHALSLAKKMAALFGISRSMRRTFTSLRSWDSSSFSAAVSAPAGPRLASTSAGRTHARTKLSASLSSRATG